MTLTTTTVLPDGIDALASAADAEGFRFVRRLIAEWGDGQNRFDRTGEALFISRDGQRLVGICGLNIDPYAHSPEIARLRHLYVAPSHRRRGIGRRLVDAAVARAREAGYTLVRLRTDTAEAAAFYASCGFAAVAGDDGFTHQLTI